MASNDLTTTSMTFTTREVERLRNFGNKTKSGVIFHDELAGPAGMSFVLIRDGNTTEDMLQQAVSQLRSDRDVVGSIKVASIEYDLEAVYKQIVDAIQNQPDEDPRTYLGALGFFEHHTGGGCMSYALFNPDDSHLLVTEQDSGLPKRMGDAWVGLYNKDGDEIRGFYLDQAVPGDSAGDYRITVGIDIPAFATINISGASSLADAMRQAETKAHEMEPHEFGADSSEWQARLRIVNVSREPHHESIDTDKVSTVILRSERTEAEEAAFEALAAIMATPMLLAGMPKSIRGKATAALELLAGATVPATPKDWEAISKS